VTIDLPLRIRVQDVWDEVRLSIPATAQAGDVKRRSLRATRIDADPDEYVLKFRGAEVSDSATLEAAGVVANANLIVLPRRRRPMLR
jgi:hypothetical protein